MQKNFTSVILILLIQNFCNAQALTDSLCAYYPFSGNASDVSGNGNNGTVHNVVLTTDRYGNANQAYSFNGTNAYIDFASNQNFKPTTFPITITAWVKSNCGALPSGMIFKNDDAADIYSGIGFQINDNGTLQIFYGDGGPTTPSYRRSGLGATYVDDNTWHFVSGIIRGFNDMEIFVDCEFDSIYYDGAGSTLSYSNSNGGTGKTDLLSGDYFYKGSIDEIRFYNRELSATELQQLFNYPTPASGISVELGNDTVLCKGQSFIITTLINGTIENYNWSTGATTNFLSVDSSGYYSVTVNNGCSFSSDTISVSFVNCKGINEHSADDVVINYVAENNSVLISNLSAVQNEKISLSLFNALGQKIISEKNISASDNYEFKLPTELPNGIYLLRIMIGNLPKTQMIVKNL